jgi:hypothetical protein
VKAPLYKTLVEDKTTDEVELSHNSEIAGQYILNVVALIKQIECRDDWYK